MKKMISVILAVCLMFVFAGCGSKEEEKIDAAICTIEQNGVVAQMAFDAKGDLITRIKQSSTINMEGYTEEQTAAVKEAVAQAETTYKDIKGVEYSVEESGTQLVENISFSADEDTLKEVIEKGLLPVQGDAKRLSLKKTIEALEGSGWIVEKK